MLTTCTPQTRANRDIRLRANQTQGGGLLFERARAITPGGRSWVLGVSPDQKSEWGRSMSCSSGTNGSVQIGHEPSDEGAIGQNVDTLAGKVADLVHNALELNTRLQGYRSERFSASSIRADNNVVR